MNTNKNSYIIIYSAVLVIVVAFLLAYIFQALKPMQDVNVALDKKKQILAALNIRDLGDVESAEKYKEVVKADMIVDANAQVVEAGEQGGENAAFKLNSADYKAGKLAVYDCEVDGKKKYVIPVYGMGLWGPIWGYIALDDDKNTVFGAYFNHDSETAGLGAEIKDSKAWQDQFVGKKIFSADGQKIAIAVKKKSDVKNPASECDAVTGATLTSDGVSLMLQDCFAKYVNFLKK
ncbi:MAG: NADH:ubiquinone reductase (Na(+)-transporting) subunit C [Prevotella sp.]